MVLRDLPVVAKPGELVALEWPTTYPDYKRFRERRDVFASAGAYIAPVPFAVSFGGHKERTWGHLVSSSYFSTLGTETPSPTRLFGAQEEVFGLAPEVVVSYRFWENHLDSDPSIVGQDDTDQWECVHGDRSRTERLPGGLSRALSSGFMDTCHRRQ